MEHTVTASAGLSAPHPGKSRTARARHRLFEAASTGRPEALQTQFSRHREHSGFGGQPGDQHIASQCGQFLQANLIDRACAVFGRTPESDHCARL